MEVLFCNMLGREWEAGARRRKKALAKAAWFRPADMVTLH